MSRVGAEPIPLPQGVEANLNGQRVQVKGPKGQLEVPTVSNEIDVKVEDGQIIVGRRSEEKQVRAFHGLTRSLIANAVKGVNEGYQKRLEIYGVGYRAESEGSRLTMQLGFSHPVVYDAPEGIQITTEEVPGEAQIAIVVQGIDKQAVGQVAAEIRFKRKPDPYKGKGVRYHDEVVHIKAGKAAVT